MATEKTLPVLPVDDDGEKTRAGPFPVPHGAPVVVYPAPAVVDSESVIAAMSTLLGKATKPLGDQTGDPLAGLKRVDSCEASWEGLRTQSRLMLERRPVGGAVSLAFTTTYDLLGANALKKATTLAANEALIERVIELENSSNEEVLAQIAEYRRGLGRSIDVTVDRLDELEEAMKGAVVSSRKLADNLAHFIHDTNAALESLKLNARKGREVNVKERLAMHMLTSRLNELRDSLEANTVGDEHLQKAVRQMEADLKVTELKRERLLKRGRPGSKSVKVVRSFSCPFSR